ncbi:ABC transporter ATP-binding protein [Ihubacter sp. rT4E-8]|uniref:ABC transporter ATP-binding protein n=1 Tax=Ihubacter sp. rT4E-8 TaxID=3242369 RepID=UPI003CF827CC
MKIELKHVSKTIRNQPVAQDICAELESGRIYGFQGINGSGKTMLMRLICGLIRPTEGEILIDGKRLGRDLTFPDSVGLFLENPAFLDRYSGMQNLKMLASIENNIGNAEVEAALRAVGLDPSDRKKYRKYSLGMKQRLGIAAAVMEQPELVILDEPTNSLDADGVQLVKGILAQQKARGALVIISCHDLAVLQEMSDEILLLEAGRVKAHLYAPAFSQAAREVR